jgi:hypothetical protein
MGATAGCGGGAAARDGGGGAGSTAGAGGMGLAGGGTAGASGGGDGAAGLPRCAVTTRPPDPINVDGGSVPAVCNTVAFGGSWLMSEGAMFGANDGVTLDGGTERFPAGGPIADGDYDLVRNVGSSAVTRRSLRVFGGGTYIEWLIENQDSTVDGGVADYRFDISAQPTGTTLAISVVCGELPITSGYGYTAGADQLLLFYEGSAPGPTVFSVFVYQRTCAR